jgi:hypothetical protein
VHVVGLDIDGALRVRPAAGGPIERIEAGDVMHVRDADE